MTHVADDLDPATECHVGGCGRRCPSCLDRILCSGPDPAPAGDQCVDCWREDRERDDERAREWSA